MQSEVVFLIAGSIAGAVLSWLITHVYYKKSTRDQTLVFNKLSLDIREAILAQPSGQINSAALMAMLERIATGPVNASRLRGPIDGGMY